VPKTGDRCSDFGVFKSECCGSEIVIASGVQFPSCSQHEGLTTWVQVRNDGDPILEQEQQAA